MLGIYQIVLLLGFITVIHAINSGSSIRQQQQPHHHFTESIVRRQIPSQTAPSGWKLSWSSKKRLSVGKSNGFISLSTIDKTANQITQTHIDQCVQQCAMKSKCGFVNVLKLSGSSLGNVVCSLYPTYQNSNEATYTSSPRNSGGNVQYSYGIRSNCAPVKGSAMTCTPKRVSTASKTSSSSLSRKTSSRSSTSTKHTTSSKSTSSTIRTSSKMTSIATTSSTSSATTTSSTSTTPFVPPPTSFSKPFYVRESPQYPKSPQGATLIQWAPCQNSKLTNPAMANGPFIDGSSSASAAFIVQHGSGSDFDNYFTDLYELVGQKFPMISPGFMTNDNSSKYFLGDMNMAFDVRGDSWSAGDNDVTGASCSSFDQHDAIVKYYSNSVKFPNLQRIVLVGHSGGANFISRYSTVTKALPIEMRYIVVNAANEAYFDELRPDLNATTSPCTPAYSYPYQWAGKGNTYVNARMGDSIPELFKQWANRNVYHLTGDQDVQTTGTQLCQSQVQGGPFRRDRNYAYWAYINLLAGTNTDVSAFHGYQSFKNQGITAISSSISFNHRQCTVAGVGHSASLMFKSDCGRAAILGSSMPAGAGASYPSSSSSSTSSSSSSHSSTQTVDDN